VNTWRAATLAARVGVESDDQFGAVMPPLYLSTNYAFESFGQPRRHDYSRSGNPTRDLLAEALTGLEGGRTATVTATGMAAIAVVTHCLPPGGRLVAPSDCYGGTVRLFQALADKRAIELEWVDFACPEQWMAAVAAADLVWVETPSNPLLRITDIAAVVEQARCGNARVVVDNTFLSPLLQQPLKLGADVVVHSTTKYINGHSDVVGGAVICADQALGEEIAWWANCLGLTGGAFDCWLTLRGLRSLSARVSVQQASAAVLAGLLQNDPGVKRVWYPGLADHPGHVLALRQQSGFGAMLSFELSGGESAVRRFVAGLERISLAESLGGVETLIAHPCTMTHAAMSPDRQRRAGLSAGLLRLSVGLEDIADLVEELQGALGRAVRPEATFGLVD